MWRSALSRNVMLMLMVSHQLNSVKDIGYIRVQYAPVIARVCGFARGAAESKKPQTSVNNWILYKYASNI